MLLQQLTLGKGFDDEEAIAWVLVHASVQGCEGYRRVWCPDGRSLGAGY